jgi:hypothetical protein
MLLLLLLLPLEANNVTDVMLSANDFDNSGLAF